MEFFADNGAGYIAEEEREQEALRRKAPDGTILYQVGSDSNIEFGIHDVHRRYEVPVDEEKLLARLIFSYEQARASMSKAHNRWVAYRGKERYDLEYMLKAEGVELESLVFFQKRYADAAAALCAFLQRTPVRDKVKKPQWERDVKIVEPLD